MMARTTMVAMTQDERSRLELIVPRADELMASTDQSPDQVPAHIRHWRRQWLKSCAAVTGFFLVVLTISVLSLRSGSALAGWVAAYWPYLLAACLLLGMVYASVNAWTFARQWRAIKRSTLGAFQIDARAGVVREERHALRDCRAVHEPEKGGRIYLLRTEDSRCLVVFDSQSFDLAHSGGDPAQSPLRPAREAILRWAPVSGLLLNLEFRGPMFPHGPAERVRGALPDWACHGRIWESDWGEVERLLSKG